MDMKNSANINFEQNEVKYNIDSDSNEPAKLDGLSDG